MISGCQYQPKSSEASSIPGVSSAESSAVVSETSSVVNSVVNSEETTIDLKEQYDENELIEVLSNYSKDGIARIKTVYEYLSPDKAQKFIEVSANEGDADSWAGDRNYLFLNDLNHFFYAYDDNYMESIGVVWIDKDTAAIAAEFIVNLKTGERKDIGKPVVNENLDGLTNRGMRSGLYIEELNSLIYITDWNLVFYLFQYDLKDGTWTELAERPFDTRHFISDYFHFKRENENEVSFNTEKKQRLSFNFYTKEFREVPYVGDYYGE
jgi:hypothetical protein